MDSNKYREIFPVIFIGIFMLTSAFMIGLGVGMDRGFEQGTNQPIDSLENQMVNNTVNRIEDLNTTNYTVSCTSEHTNIDSNYVCTGFVEKGKGYFNIVFRSNCKTANTTSCRFNYWDRGNFLFSQ